MTKAQLKEKLESLEKQISVELAAIPNSEWPACRIHKENQTLGKNGSFTALAATIRELPNEEKKAAGKIINASKQLILDLYAEKDREAQKTDTPVYQDLTVPPITLTSGHLHPITHAIEEITRIFENIGFKRVRYPEVDTDYYVFEALNMPPTHPARDEWETFFVNNPADPTQENLVMTTHTSNGQPREMLRLGKPPIRMVNISRCYRRQQDVTHTQMFHQFEGMVIDKGINITHLKGVLDHFAAEFYGEGTKSRLRPYHFQFTEPSFEIDFSCHICHGTTQIKDEQTGETSKCKFCKSGWHEVGGAGMMHPNVLRAGGIDPEEFTGFAFGWGVERTYTLRPGLNIDDIRLFYSGNLEFLKQF